MFGGLLLGSELSLEGIEGYKCGWMYRKEKFP